MSKVLFQTTATSALAGIALSACSGGGGASASAPPPPPPPPAAVFTVSASAPSDGTEADKIDLSAASSNASGTVSYSWTQTSGPNALIEHADTSSPTIQVPLLLAADTLIFELTGTDGSGATSIDTESISANLAPPITVLEFETSHDSVARAYLVYTPENAVPDAPLVMFLHGASGSAEEFIADGETPRDWLTLADQEGFIVAFPNGFSNSDGDGLGDRQSWNDIGGRLSSGDDAGFLLSLIDEISNGRDIDTQKVLIGGRSNGAMMSYRMAIEHPTKFAAVAAFVGNLAVDPIPVPMPLPTPPILIFGGTDDPVVNFNGNANQRSIPETVEYFVENTWTDTSLAVSRVALDDADPSDGCLMFSETYTDSTGQPTVLYYEGVGSGHYIPDPDFEQSQKNITGRGPVICRDANGVELANAFFEQVLSGTTVDTGTGGSSLTPLETGGNGLFAGMSFFVPVATAFNIAVETGGFPDHGFDFFFQGGANGAPQSLWDNESWRAEIDGKLATGNVDLFGLSIPNGTEQNPGEAYGLWFNQALSYNPETTFFIGVPYLSGGYRKTPEAFEQEMIDLAENFFPVAEALRENYQDNDIYFIHYGLVLSEMMEDFEAGELEDIIGLVDPTNTSGGGEGYIYEDNMSGHAGPMAEHIAGLIWAHYLYDADIENLVDPQYEADDVLRIANDVIAFNRRYLPASETE